MKHLLSALLLAITMPVATWAQTDTATSPDEKSLHDREQAKLVERAKAPDGYYFNYQVIELKVHYDRTIDVVEYLCANFLEESRGLYRSIPKRFWVNRDVSEAQDGSKYEMRYNAVEINSLKVSEEFMPEDLDSLLDIRIGSPEVWIKGRHHYELSYTLNIPNDDRVDASDLFFHSIIGSGWSCSTDTVFFKVEFDDEIPSASLDSLKVFCGREGDETNKADQILFQRDSKMLKGRYLGLQPLEAITIHLPLPDGYFAPGKIPFWRTLAWIGAGLTLLLLLYVFFRELKGDELVTPVVTFRPSKGLTSADIGSLVDGKVDDIDLLSVIPWLAAEGYINMTQENDKTKITPGKKEISNDLPDYMVSLYQGFFAKKEVFNIDSPTPQFGSKWMTAKKSLERKYNGKLIGDNGIIVLFLLTLCFALTCCWSSVPPEGFVTGGLVHVMLILAYFFYAGFGNFKKKLSFKNGNGCMAVLYLLLLIFIVPMGAAIYLGAICTNDDNYLPETLLIVLGIAVALAVIFQRRMDRLSPLRRQHLGEILGLKEFILTAEKDRLEMLLKEDERYFYHILPYAMVFGLVDEWAAKFDGLTVPRVAEFGNIETSSMKSLLFSKDMNNMARRSIYAAVPTSSHSSSGNTSWRSHSSSGSSYRSSSSHSGGYSGGGSGGGGGRRW